MVGMKPIGGDVPDSLIMEVPPSDIWADRASDWLGWMLREEEGSSPGTGPADDGHAYISFPGTSLEPNGLIDDYNETDRDLATIYARCDGDDERVYDGAISFIIPSKLFGNKTTATLKLSFWKYIEKTPTTFDVKVYINKQGLTPQLAATHSIVPEFTSDPVTAEYSLNVDLSSEITSDGLYEVWIQADIETVNDSSTTKKTYAAIFNPVDLRLSFLDTAVSASANTIKMGSTATAWGSLSETTLERYTPLSLSVDYRGATVFQWEADADDGFDLDAQINKRVQLEVGGTVRFRGRVQDVQRSGITHRYRFTCVDFRGNARNVPLEKDPSSSPSIPMRLYNADPEDPDFSKCEATGQTVGEIIQDIIDDHKTLMLAEDALYSTGSGDMYESSELSALDYIPGKIQLKEVNIEQALTRVLSEMGKSYAMFTDPVDGKYHFYNIRDEGTSRDVVIDSDSNEHSLQHSVDGCYTALQIYGSLAAGDTVKKVKIGPSGGYDASGNALSGLTPAWDTSLEPENLGDWDLSKSVGERDYCIQTAKSPGPTISIVTDASKAWDVDFWIGGVIWFPKLSTTKYTITDSGASSITFTHGIGQSPLYDVSNGDPFWIVLDTDYTYVFRLYTIDDSAAREILEGGKFSGMDCCPRLYAYGFVNDDPAQGIATKIAIPIKIIREAFSTPDTDYNSPPYILAQYPLWKSDATYTYIESLNVALEYCYRSTGGVELKVRYPSSSFQGTAYSVHGIERVKSIIIDEYEDPEDESGLESLAEELLKPYKDSRTWGAIPLDSIDWDYADLYSLINIARDGQSAADLEGISLVGVRYDFMSESTRLDLTNDFRDGFGYDRLLDRFVKDLKTSADFDEGHLQDDFIKCSKGEVLAHTGTTDLEENLDTEIEDPHNPTWGDYNVGQAGARCDTATYSHAGGQPTPQAQMFLCDDSMYGQSYVTTSGSKGDVHGVTLRKGTGLGGAGQANTHLFYPYLCTGGDPTTSYGKCTGAMKQIEIVVPEGTPAARANMADFLPLFLKCYANFIKFTSQGMACLDDRIYRLDYELWGGTNPNNLVIRICQMVKTCVVFLANRISDIDNHYSWKAAAVEEDCSGGHCGGFCRLIVSCGPAIGPMSQESKIDYRDSPVCSDGLESPDCCTGVRKYNPPRLV